MGHSIVKKKTVLNTVQEGCEGLKALIDLVNYTTVTESFDVDQKIHFFNGVIYKGHYLSILHLNEVQHKWPSKRFAKVESKTSY